MREIINLMESGIPPELYWDSGEDYWVLNGYHCHALMGGDPKTHLIIYEFTSSMSGQGNAEKILRWLKNLCPEIVVHDPGHESTSPEAFGFWSKMAEKKIVDEIQDENDRILFKNGQWFSHTDGWADQ